MGKYFVLYFYPLVASQSFLCLTFDDNATVVQFIAQQICVQVHARARLVLDSANDSIWDPQEERRQWLRKRERQMEPYARAPNSSSRSDEPAFSSSHADVTRSVEASGTELIGAGEMQSADRNRSVEQGGRDGKHGARHELAAALNVNPSRSPLRLSTEKAR